MSQVSLALALSQSLSSLRFSDKRTLAWIKLKKDYVTGLGDSLDVVPIGAWHGNGRKAAWWSPVLLGLWDEGQGKLVAVCKCMSGAIFCPSLLI